VGSLRLRRNDHGVAPGMRSRGLSVGWNMMIIINLRQKKPTQVVHSGVGGGEVLQRGLQQRVGKLGVIDSARQQQCAD